jgi:hypothetical protein
MPEKRHDSWIKRLNSVLIQKAFGDNLSNNHGPAAVAER